MKGAVKAYEAWEYRNAVGSFGDWPILDVLFLDFGGTVAAGCAPLTVCAPYRSYNTC